MLWLKQSTVVTVHFGPFLDATDGVALEVGLAAALDNATTGIRVSPNGGNYVDRSSSTAPTYDETGEYFVELDATDTGALGTLKIIFEESATCLPVWSEFMVVPANVWDSLFGADALDVNVAEWLGTAPKTPATAGVPKVDMDLLFGVLLTEGGAGRLKAAFTTLFDVATPALTCTDVMRGTDGVDTATMVGTDSAALATALTTAQNDLDTLTGTGGALIATAQTATAWSALEASAETIKEGTAKAGTLTPTDMSTTMTEVNDVFNGRILIFKADTTTAALRLQATDITDYVNTNGVLTFTAVTVAPAATETFIIV